MTLTPGLNIQWFVKSAVAICQRRLAMEYKSTLIIHVEIKTLH